MSTAVFFWLFVAICIVTSVIVSLQKSKARMDVLRAAIEKGQVLDPALIRSLLTRDASRRMSPRSLLIPGVVIAAAGVGCSVWGLFMGRIDEDALYTFLGAGLGAVSAGIVMLVGAKVWQRSLNSGTGWRDEQSSP